MGQRTTQRILECAICKTIPANGEPMWEMYADYWCDSCCEEQENETKERHREHR